MSKTPEAITKALLEPFPANALKRRSDRGSTFTYVEGQTVIRRLIDATGNAFDVDVVEQSITPYGQTAKGKDRVIITARVRLTIPGLGSREHMGVQVTSVDSGEDLYKGAISDAIKKAATLFGVGLDLYGPDYEAGEVATERYGEPEKWGPGSGGGPARRAPVMATEAPSAQVASERQRQMVRERWSALGLDPRKLDAQSRKWYGARVFDLTRADAEDMIRRLDQKITAASPRGLTPQPAELSPAEITDMADDERMDDETDTPEPLFTPEQQAALDAEVEAKRRKFALTR